MTTFKSMLHPKHIVDSVKTTFRKRPDHKRTVLLALLVNMLLLARIISNFFTNKCVVVTAR